MADLQAKRYFMRITAPGWSGRHLSIDNATMPQIVDWLFTQLRPGVLSNTPERFEIVAFDEVQ